MSEQPAQDFSGGDYAKQWIDYLQRRNRALSIVWPVLLLLALIALAGLLFFYQQKAMQDVELARIEGEIAAIESAKQSQTRELVSLQESHQRLQKDYQLLNDSLDQTEQERQTQFQIGQEMVKNLKSQVEVLTEENQQLLALVDEAKAQVSAIAGDQKNALSTIRNQFEQERQVLANELANRKQAYEALVRRQRETRQEMDRLANVVNAQKQEVSSISKQNDNLRRQLQSSEKEKLALAGEVAALNQKLTQLVAPIPVQDTPAPLPPANNGKAEAQQQSAVPTQTGGNQSASAFDFDSIAIDRP